MVATKDYSVLPHQQAYKIKAEESPLIAEAGGLSDGESAMELRSTVLTNDVIITWTTGEPGDIIPWHSHSPEMYQVLVNIEGECKWYYRDNEGDVKTIVAGPNELVYLPAGAENKVEVVGDEFHSHYGVLKRPRVHRVEHLVGETAGLYNPKEFPAAFVFDDMNDRIVRQEDDVVTK